MTIWPTPTKWKLILPTANVHLTVFMTPSHFVLRMPFSCLLNMQSISHIKKLCISLRGEVEKLWVQWIFHRFRKKNSESSTWAPSRVSTLKRASLKWCALEQSLCKLFSLVALTHFLYECSGHPKCNICLPNCYKQDERKKKSLKLLKSRDTERSVWFMQPLCVHQECTWGTKFSLITKSWITLVRKRGMVRYF